MVDLMMNITLARSGFSSTATRLRSPTKTKTP